MTKIPEPQCCGSCGNYWFGAHSCYAESKLSKITVDPGVLFSTIATNDGLECIRLQAEIDHMKRAHAVEIAKVIEISERDHASAKASLRADVARYRKLAEEYMEKDRILLDYNPPTAAEMNARAAESARRTAIYLCIVALIALIFVAASLYLKFTQ